MNDEARSPVAEAQYGLHGGQGHRDASGRRLETWPRQMEEDGAAQALNARPLVVGRNHHDIVKRILPAEIFVG
jgi:hypothetical protein